jgi:hypothetical protein
LEYDLPIFFLFAFPWDGDRKGEDAASVSYVDIVDLE